MESELSFRIKENSWVARIAALKLNANAVAIVFGNTIHLHNATKEELLANKRWLKHELCHICQYQQHGYYRFIWKYLIESVRHGYYNNRFEKEARDAEETG